MAPAPAGGRRARELPASHPVERGDAPDPGSSPRRRVAGPDANVTVDGAGAAGTASTFARSAHGHEAAVTTPLDVAAGTIYVGFTRNLTGAMQFRWSRAWREANGPRTPGAEPGLRRGSPA